MDKQRDGHIEEAVLQVLKYYDYFHYPLTLAEIHFNFPHEETLAAIEQSLKDLVQMERIFRTGQLYSLRKDDKIIQRRIKGNKFAEKKLKKAYRVARFINAFPFVETVFISGSLSKNYADERTDLDFFICTAPNKLWVARTFLHLFKKLTFVVGRQHDFCMNYFLAVDHLRIEEQNIYTAIEMATLKPHRKNDKILSELLEANDWIRKYLPNFYNELIFDHFYSKANRWNKFLFENHWFDELNSRLMMMTDKHWRKKWSKRNFPMGEYALAFKTRLYVSKNHPRNYQKEVLEHNKAAGYNE